MIRFVTFFSLVFIFYSTISQSKTDRAQLLYEDALSQYRLGQLSESLVDLKEALSLQPNADMYYFEGLIYERLDQPLRAVSSFEACIRFDQSYSEAVFQKALIYLNHGDPRQALKDFNSLIGSGKSNQTHSIYFEIDESGSNQNQVMSLQTMQAKLLYYRAQTYMKLDEIDHAISDYKESLSIDNHPDYYVGLGLAYSAQGDVESAKMNFAEAVRIDPTNQLGWYNLVLVAPETEISNEVTSNIEDGVLVNLLAARAMENGDYTQAIGFFNRSIKSNPNEVLSYINRGRAKSKVGEYESARADFKQARKISPKRAEAFYLIGNTYFLEKNFKASLIFYDQYLALEPDNALIWYNGAMAHLELDQETQACIYLSRASNYGMVQAKRWENKYCNR